MKKSQMARIVEFDQQVRAGRYPSRRSFSVDYEISERTLARDIDFLRYQLDAPLEYDRNRRGYFYSSPWSVPAVVSISSIKERNRLSSVIEQVKQLSAVEWQQVLDVMGIPQFVQPATDFASLPEVRVA